MTNIDRNNAIFKGTRHNRMEVTQQGRHSAAPVDKQINGKMAHPTGCVVVIILSCRYRRYEDVVVKKITLL